MGRSAASREDLRFGDDITLLVAQDGLRCDNTSYIFVRLLQPAHVGVPASWCYSRAWLCPMWQPGLYHLDSFFMRWLPKPFSLQHPNLPFFGLPKPTSSAPPSFHAPFCVAKPHCSAMSKIENQHQLEISNMATGCVSAKTLRSLCHYNEIHHGEYSCHLWDLNKKGECLGEHGSGQHLSTCLISSLFRKFNSASPDTVSPFPTS